MKIKDGKKSDQNIGIATDNFNQLFIYSECMIDRLYYRCQDLVKLWRNIKTRWKLLSYRDKYRDVKEQREKRDTNE